MLKPGLQCGRDSHRSMSNVLVKRLKSVAIAPALAFAQKDLPTQTHTQRRTHTRTCLLAARKSAFSEKLAWKKTPHPIANPTCPRPLNSPENRPTLYPPYLDDCAKDKCSAFLCGDSHKHTSCSSYRARTPCKFSSSAEADYTALMSTLQRCFPLPSVFSVLNSISFTVCDFYT